MVFDFFFFFGSGSDPSWLGSNRFAGRWADPRKSPASPRGHSRHFFKGCWVGFTAEDPQKEKLHHQEHCIFQSPKQEHSLSPSVSVLKSSYKEGMPWLGRKKGFH